MSSSSAKVTQSAQAVKALPLEEARTTMQMLDDAYRIILEEVHHTYPTKGNQPVAAKIVRELQQIMGEKGWPRSRFLGVQGLLMNQEHQARDTWEKTAVQSMRSGVDQIETVENGRLRAVRVIDLNGPCFACHWSGSGVDSKAAISWNIPVR